MTEESVNVFPVNFKAMISATYFQLFNFLYIHQYNSLYTNYYLFYNETLALDNKLSQF
jgi:hypothetical protein